MSTNLVSSVKRVFNPCLFNLFDHAIASARHVNLYLKLHIAHKYVALLSRTRIAYKHVALHSSKIAVKLRNQLQFGGFMYPK